MATVAAILEAAAHIIERRGLAAFNTNLTAEKAGVSIGSLYQYFPTKDAILAELIRGERKSLLNGMEAVAADAGRLEDALDGFIWVGLRHQLGRPRLSNALESSAVSRLMAQEDEILGNAIAAAVARVLNTHAVSEPQQAAHDVVALARGMIDAAGLRGETDMASLAPRVRRAVLGYLNKEPVA